jgi:hypothetical protein
MSISTGGEAEYGKKHLIELPHLGYFEERQVTKREKAWKNTKHNSQQLFF